MKGFKISSDKSGAIDSVKFIFAVLKQHKNDLGRLITELGIIADKVKKIEEITEHIHLIADNISELIELPNADKPLFKQKDP